MAVLDAGNSFLGKFSCCLTTTGFVISQTNSEQGFLSQIILFLVMYWNRHWYFFPLRMQFSIEYLKDMCFLLVFDMFLLSLFSHLIPCAFPVQTVTCLCIRNMPVLQTLDLRSSITVVTFLTNTSLGCFLYRCLSVTHTSFQQPWSQTKQRFQSLSRKCCCHCSSGCSFNLDGSCVLTTLNKERKLMLCWIHFLDY